MRKVNTILSEILKIIPQDHFSALSEKYKTNRYAKKFTTFDQLITLIYSQSKGSESLRDIESSLLLNQSRWYHLGYHGMKRSTFADSMARRDYRVFEELFYKMLKICRSKSPKNRFRFNNPLHSLDSTTIDLCLSSFPWARYKNRKGAIKIHCMYDNKGCLPEFAVITDGKTHDVTAVKENALMLQSLMPDSIISFDKAYIDYELLNTLDQRGVYFVTRIKTNLVYRLLGRHKEIKHNNIIDDDIIALDSARGKKLYHGKLRLVKYIDPISGKIYEFMTNNMNLAAKTIADIYKSRWDIELFFKWIKQNLKIKTFLGTSKNAVLSQVWVAMIYLLILSYIKHQTKFNRTITTLHRIIRDTLMERQNLIDILFYDLLPKNKTNDLDIQLQFF